MVIHAQRHPIAGLAARGAGENQFALIIGQRPSSSVRRGRIERVRHQVHTNQRQGLLGLHQHRMIFDARPHCDRQGQRGQPGIELLIDAAHGGHFVVGLARQRLHGRTKRTRRRIARQFNGQHHRNTQRHREHGQQRPYRFGAQWPQYEPGEEANHRVAIIRPSRISTTRSTTAVDSAL